LRGKEDANASTFPNNTKKVFLHVWVLFLLSRPLEIHDMMDESLPPGAVPPTGLPHALVHSDSPAAAGI
jgi:hypothetical protein